MSQNEVTSHSALFTLILIDSDSFFDFFTFCLSLSVYSFVFLCCVITFSATSAVFLFVCLFLWLCNYCLSLWFSHIKKMIQMKMHASTYTKMKMHTPNKTQTPILWLLFVLHPEAWFKCMCYFGQLLSVFNLSSIYRLSLFSFSYPYSQHISIFTSISFCLSSWTLLGSDPHCWLVSDCQPHYLFCDQGMSKRGIKYSVWGHAVQATVSSLYFVHCVSVVFSHGLKLCVLF